MICSPVFFNIISAEASNFLFVAVMIPVKRVWCVPTSMISRARKYWLTKVGLVSVSVLTILSIRDFRFTSMSCRIMVLIWRFASERLIIAFRGLAVALR